MSAEFNMACLVVTCDEYNINWTFSEGLLLAMHRKSFSNVVSSTVFFTCAIKSVAETSSYVVFVIFWSLDGIRFVY